jgi:hypothetical protein
VADSSAHTGPTTRFAEEPGGPRCAACGTRNPPGADFCVLCGRALAERPVADAPERVAPPVLAPPLAPDLPAPRVAPPPPALVPRRRRGIPGNIIGALFLFGIAAVAFTGLWWPGILVVIGAVSMIEALGKGNVREAATRSIWFFGIAVLAYYSLWWPGILILIGISIIAESVLPRRRRA